MASHNNFLHLTGVSLRSTPAGEKSVGVLLNGDLMIHAKILAGLQKELQNKYEISSTIRHKGERGRKRENGVAEFLKENLPDAYGVGTGELFSFDVEGTSPQCDIVVYDRMRTPVFGKQGTVQQIPIEGVYVVIEVRSVLDTHALKDTARKFQAIRELWAAAHPKKGRKNNQGEGPSFYLFGFKQMTTENSCLQFLKSNSEEDCTIVALDSGSSVWVGPSNRSKPARPVWLNSTDPEAGLYSTLAFFFFGILACCQKEMQHLNIIRILHTC
jgi:hypothetical protein